MIFVPPTPLCGGGGKSAVLCSVVSAVCGCLGRCQWRPPPRPDHTNKQHTQHLNISIWIFCDFTGTIVCEGLYPSLFLYLSVSVIPVNYLPNVLLGNLIQMCVEEPFMDILNIVCWNLELGDDICMADGAGTRHWSLPSSGWTVSR